MSYLDRLMRQTATHWELHGTTPYDQFGDPAYKSTAPQLLTPDEQNGVYWQDRSDKVIDATGEEVVTKSVVWSVTVAFEPGDYLYLGTSSSTNPETVSGADQIKRVEKHFDTKSSLYVFKAFL